MDRPFTLSNFLARSFQQSVDLWEQSAAGWNSRKARREHGNACAEREVRAYTERADAARAARDAAPVKIIAVYADGREEVIV